MDHRWHLQKETAILDNKLDDGSDDGRVHYGQVKFRGTEFRVGDNAYFHPEVFSFSAKPTVVKKTKQDRSMVCGLFVSCRLLSLK